MKKVLIIDNYDSFVYNLFQCVKEADPGAEVTVARNDTMTPEQVRDMALTHIIISPGPGRPETAGITLEVISQCGEVPVLGVCLGHQAIAQAFGGRVIHAAHIVHGKTSEIHHTETGVLAEVANPFSATRYHSLAVEEKTLPSCLAVTAKNDEGEIMALQHREKQIFGVQFHPESILTPEGKKIIRNFLAFGPGRKSILSASFARPSGGIFEEGLQKLISKEDLSREESARMTRDIMAGRVSDAKIAGFLTAMRMKGETGDELAGMACVMQEKAEQVSAPDKRTADTCGTGGDGAGTCNVSTAAAFVVAAGGIPVAKHGNRSVSSKVGSADVLEAGGYRMQKTPEEMTEELRANGFTFLFAPLLHPAMKYVMPARRQLKVRTAFNLLGPVTNPARVKYQLVGVFDFSYAQRLAQALQAVGTERSLVVSGGFTDELTTCGENKAVLVTEKEIVPFAVDIEKLGLHRGRRKDLDGEEDPKKAFFMMEQILSGKAHRTQVETVALNAGVLFFVTGDTATLREGVAKAMDMIESKKAREKMEEIFAYQGREGRT